MREVRSDYGADFLIEEVLIAVHRHLMRSADQLQSVDLVELLRDISAEDPSRASEVAFEATLERENKLTLRCPARDPTREDLRRDPRSPPLGSGRCC